jgi:hypothetical protein
MLSLALLLVVIALVLAAVGQVKYAVILLCIVHLLGSVRL